jgi:putative flippase GtrA
MNAQSTSEASKGVNRFAGVAAHIPPAQFFRYLLIGGWNTLFGYGCFALFTALLEPRIRYGYVIASAIANLIAITVSYLGYKWFVFRTKGNYLKEWLRCVTVYTGSMLVSIALLPVVVFSLRRTTSITASAPYVAGALIMALSVIYTFLAHKKFSFRQNAEVSSLHDH